MAYRTVYVVSKDPAVRDSLAELAVSAGLRTETLPSVDAWLEVAEPEPGGCIVLDAGAADLIDPQRCEQFARVCTRIPVLVLTDRGDIPTAVRALKQGAADVLQKPVRGQNLLERIKRAVEMKGDVASDTHRS
jgi:FixJ family two-component response regulator